MLCQYSGWSMNVSVLVNLMNLEHSVCVPSFMKFSLYQTKRRKVTWLPVLTFYTSRIYRCCWQQHLVCGSPCSWPCVYLAHALSFASGWTCKKAAVVSLSLAQRPPGPWVSRARLQQQSRRGSWAWSCWKQWPLLTSFENRDAFSVNLWNK